MATELKELPSLLTQKEIEDKCKSIEKSSHKLQSLVRNCHSLKLKNIDKWLEFESRNFLEENAKKNTRFHLYERGTIVFVNFGTSIGAELSGYHFAIVLNHKDNNKNGLLNVLPLTSKESKFSYPLGKKIYNIIFENVENQLRISENLSEKFKNFKEARSNNNKEFALWFDESSYNYLLDSVKTKANLTHNRRINCNELIEENLLLLAQAKEFYQKFNKESFVKLGSITSISKFRIIKAINRIDPIGKIHLSSDIMQSIDTELAKILLSLDIDTISHK